jgi:hypothetical protein
MLIPSYYDAPDRWEGSVPMRGDDPRNDSMFSYVTPEARVRPDQPLRPIRRMTDAALERLLPRFDRLYSTTGRPSIPPEKPLRALLLQMLYSIHSERLLDGGVSIAACGTAGSWAWPGRCDLGRDDVYEEARSDCCPAMWPMPSSPRCSRRSSRRACSRTRISPSTVRCCAFLYTSNNSALVKLSA